MSKPAAFVLLVLLMLAAASLPVPAASRSVEAVYVGAVSEIPEGVKQLQVWVPIPASGLHQEISEIEILSPYNWKMAREDEFGNRYIYTTIENPPAGELTVRVWVRATRRTALMASLPRVNPSKGELERNLRADRLVTLSPRVRKLAEEVTAEARGPIEQARAIYDHLLATMRYNKNVPGWGMGDTERACDIRTGNCTDFHSLFMSLARARGIPARFIIGFPMPEKPRGETNGYHCWAEFYVEGKGWIPVDPAEASKSSDPAVRKFLFGNLDADRIQVTIGRDLVLDPRTSQPLNYFFYPYAETEGRPVGKGSARLQYSDISPLAAGSE